MAAPGTCAFCGKPLEDRRRRYCSTVCRDRARRERVYVPKADASVPTGEAIADDSGARQLILLALILLLTAAGIYLSRRR